jgi:DNA-binding HxlR family transcriptional regulator
MVPTSRTTGKPVVIQDQCPTHEVMGLIGDRWSILVLIALHDNGESRSADLLRGVRGISRKMLTQTLRALERNGLIAREVVPTVPVSVSYRLTPLGTSLVGALRPVRDWAETHIDEIHAARAGAGGTASGS